MLYKCIRHIKSIPHNSVILHANFALFCNINLHKIINMHRISLKIGTKVEKVVPQTMLRSDFP